MQPPTVAAACDNSSARAAYVLDDEAQIGTLICRVLLGVGFAPSQFTSPLPFLIEIENSPPDLIVLDLALGQSDAVEVIRHLEILKYRGKVLLISGHDETTLVQITEIGERHGLAMLPPLRKPFPAADLESRLTVAAGVEDRRPGAKDARPEAREVRRTAVDLEQALRNDWLELWYQPKIDLESLSVCGAEALLRGRHPEHGIVSADDLLPPSGDPLYRPLTEFVIRRAMTDWVYFADQDLPLRLAVNLPASTMHAPDFIGFVRQSLPQDPRFPGLIIEVTEDEAIRNHEYIHEVVAQLKLYNVAISIDDFGTGCTSLFRLLEVPCVELKLDRDLVSDCSSNRLKAALCQTVVDLAHQFGASVCAEGVETLEDLRCLIAMGCDTAQGFLFGKPMQRDIFVRALLGRAAQSKNGPSPSPGSRSGQTGSAVTA